MSERISRKKNEFMPTPEKMLKTNTELVDIEAQIGVLEGEKSAYEKRYGIKLNPEKDPVDAIQARADEIARTPLIGGNRLTAEQLAITEYQFTPRLLEGGLSPQEKEEIREQIGEIIAAMLGEDARVHEQESIDLVLKRTLSETQQGIPFMTALISNVERRNDKAREMRVSGVVKLNSKTGAVEEVAPSRHHSRPQE